MDFSNELVESIRAMRRAKRTRRGEYSAGLWQRSIPRSLAIVKVLQEYARAGNRLEWAGRGHVSLDSLTPMPQGLGVAITGKILGGDMNIGATLPYPNELMRHLLAGHVCELGVATIRMPQILPTVSPGADGSVLIEWQKPIELSIGTKWPLFPNPFRWLSSSTISGIRVTESTGDFIARGIVGWTLPQLVWD
jgi:hypothetical protein